MFKHTSCAITVDQPTSKNIDARKKKESTHTKTFSRKSSIDRSKGKKKNDLTPNKYWLFCKFLRPG